MPSYAGSAAVIRDGFKPLLLLYSVISDTSLYPPLFNPRISPANPSTFSDIIYRFLSSCLTWKNPHTRFNFTGVKDIWRNHHEIRKRNLQPASAPRRQQLLRGVPLHSLWCHPRYCQSGTAHLLSKGLYVEISAEYRTSIGCVERNIRTIISTIWLHGDRTLLNQVFGFELEQKPRNGAFIDALSHYVVEHYYDWFCKIYLGYPSAYSKVMILQNHKKRREARPGDHRVCLLCSYIVSF